MINRGALDLQVSADGEDEKQQYVNVEDGARGLGTRPSQMSVPARMSASEQKRVGKVYARDDPLDKVVAAEMARI